MDLNALQARKIAEKSLMAPAILEQALADPRLAQHPDLCAFLVAFRQISPQWAEAIRRECPPPTAADPTSVSASAPGSAMIRQPAASGAISASGSVSGSRLGEIELRGFDPSDDPELARALDELRVLYREARKVDPLFAPHADAVLEPIDKLGEGGMGVVYRVRDRRLDREAAMKVLQGADKDGRPRQRFLRELRITARLDHPSIPPVYEAGVTAEGRTYLLMRVIEGQTLGARIAAAHGKKKRRDSDVRELLEALVKVADAVAYAHSRKILHRDLKPENVMVGRFGEVMVMDWGLARDLEEGEDEDARLRAETPAIDSAEVKKAGLTQAGAIIGTPGYMPPEQARGEDVDARADVYALGAMLTEILTGELPVGGDTVLVRMVGTMEGRIRRPRELNRAAPRELDSLAVAALASDRERRIASAEAFAQDLRAFLAARDLAAHRYSLWEKLVRAARRRPAALVASAAGMLLLAVAGLLWTEIERSRRSRLQAQEQTERADEARRLAEETAGRVKATMALLTQAQALARRGRDEASIAAKVDAALESGGRTLPLLIAAAEVFEDGGLDERAVALLEEGAKAFPPATEALFGLHRLAVKADAELAARATPALTRLAAAEAQDEYTLFARGVTAEDSEEAIKLFDELLERTDRFTWAFVGRGAAKIKAGRRAEGLEDLDRAVKLGPAEPAPYWLRSRARREAGRMRDGLSDLRRFVELAPRSRQAAEARALIAELRARLAKKPG